MQVKFIATGNSPTYYEFQNEKVIAHYENQTEEFDLSSLQEGDQFQQLQVDTLNLNGSHIIRNAYRDGSGELHVTLCQQVGPGHWKEGIEFDPIDYDPTKIQVVWDASKSFAGRAWAMTQNGKIYVGEN